MKLIHKPPMSKLPSLKSMQAFEATARHVSFSRASEELCVSQSAVSHQVKALELFLGMQLLNRNNCNVSLTESGDIYYSVITDCFKRMQTVTDQVMKQSDVKLRVIAQTSIAVDWLAPKITFFNKQHPTIDVSLSMATRLEDFDATDYDVVVGTWPAPTNFTAKKIRNECWFPVCTKELYKKIDPEDPYSILRLPLFSSENGQDWGFWMQHHDLDKPPKLNIQEFSHTLLSAKAALSGTGVALSCDFIVFDAIERGLLVPIKSKSYILPWGHYFAHHRTESCYNEQIEIFIDWMMQICNGEK